MNRIDMTRRALRRAGLVAGIAVVAMGAMGACSHLMMRAHGRDVAPPPVEEFGFGPRSSGSGIYRAVAEPADPIRVGQLHGWTLRIEDAHGVAVDGAAIEVDGGMPQHGHGLPTRPRVTRALGGGAYHVDGIRFNMGGWWEVTFHIAAGAGTDHVTFNLDL
jgi:hypothetical protein